MMTRGPVQEGEASTHKLASYELVPSAAASVLDVGCGAGEDVLALAERLGPRCLIVGIDVSLERVDEAQRALRNVALNARFAVGDARSLPFSDDGFDVVRADGLFSALSERARALRELARVAAPGGRILIHDLESAVLAPSADEDDTLALMRRAGLASVELSEAPRRPHAAVPRQLTLLGIKPKEGGRFGQP